MFCVYFFNKVYLPISLFIYGRSEITYNDWVFAKKAPIHQEISGLFLQISCCRMFLYNNYIPLLDQENHSK